MVYFTHVVDLKNSFKKYCLFHKNGKKQMQNHVVEARPSASVMGAEHSRAVIRSDTDWSRLQC